MVEKLNAWSGGHKKTFFQKVLSERKFKSVKVHKYFSMWTVKTKCTERNENSTKTLITR